MVIDFYFHGLEDEDFGKDQMKRFVDEVVPLMGAVREGRSRA